MKYLWWSVLAVCCGCLAGCGGNEDRAPLAKQVTQTYWNDVSRYHSHQAFQLLTSGNRASRKESDFSKSVIGFLVQTGGITARVGSPAVNGDQATVPVTLFAVGGRARRSGYQHLYWEDGHWRVTDFPGLFSSVK